MASLSIDLNTSAYTDITPPPTPVLEKSIDDLWVSKTADADSINPIWSSDSEHADLKTSSEIKCECHGSIAIECLCVKHSYMEKSNSIDCVCKIPYMSRTTVQGI